MKASGIIILITGIILGIYALSFDTSVKVDYGGYSYGLPERVNNIGLMNSQRNYIFVSGILSIIGIIIIVSANKKSVSETFKETLEKAKKAEYIEDVDSALNLYRETVYHLENDYSDKNLSKEWNNSRLQLLESLKKKTEENRRNQK